MWGAMTAWLELVDLAQERLGGAVVWANDEFFAPKENLLKPSAPVFLEGKYTDRGKWMDGWETRRRRTPGHDACVVRLGAPGIVRGVVVDTAFFKGNYPEHASIDACAVDGQPSPEELLAPETAWFELLPRTALAGDTKNLFAVACPWRVTHLRLNIHPDGGVARLRVHGEVVPDARWLARASEGQIDLASVENGGAVRLASDMFFGSRHNLVMPGRGVDMGDGWETKRSRRPGFDWAILELAGAGTIDLVEVDTHHFKGNAPESCALAVCHAPGADAATLAGSAEWSELLPRTRLQPHARHLFDRELLRHAPATHARFCIYPDGGVSRLRLWGSLSGEGHEHTGLRRLAALTPAEHAREMLACCGAHAWAEAMTARRPFDTLARLTAAGAEVWRGLGREDWLEAFRAHPRIGEKRKGESTRPWSSEEQARVKDAQQATLDALARENEAYEKRFGFIYIVCATGKTADEMLAILRERIRNDDASELRRAAEEQEKITAIRLEKLVMR
jgi:allantoicase